MPRRMLFYRERCERAELCILLVPESTTRLTPSTQTYDLLMFSRPRSLFSLLYFPQCSAQMSSSPLSKKRRLSESETKTGSNCSSGKSVQTDLREAPANVRLWAVVWVLFYIRSGWGELVPVSLDCLLLGNTRWRVHLCLYLLVGFLQVPTWQATPIRHVLDEIVLCFDPSLIYLDANSDIIINHVT